jgi:hypothetical protein
VSGTIQTHGYRYIFSCSDCLRRVIVGGSDEELEMDLHGIIREEGWWVETAGDETRFLCPVCVCNQVAEKGGDSLCPRP